jgi:hypothetical protein
VPDAVPECDGRQGLPPLGLAGQTAHLLLAPRTSHRADGDQVLTSISLLDQGPLQVLQASMTRPAPRQPYLLALSHRLDGGGELEPLSAFMTRPAGSAIVNAVGPIRQIVRGERDVPRRYLVVAPGTAEQHGAPVHLQVPG